MSKRPKIGLTIDFVLRSPQFVEAYSKLKNLIIVESNNIQFEISNVDVDSYWLKIKNNQEKMNFYFKTITPISENDVDFDYTFKKYFYNEEDRIRFLSDYSYDIYAQSPAVSKKIIEIINFSQSKLADIYLFERVHSPRKTANTLFWLSKNSVQFKGIEFVSPNDQINDYTIGFKGLYDPYQNENKFLNYKIEKESNKYLLDFLQEIEKTIK